jgi:acetoin utilization protein AcuC
VSCRTGVVWHDDYLGYNFGTHPMSPWRLELTMDLAQQIGALEHATLLTPAPASDALLLTAHTQAYLAALREASVDPSYYGFGLGSTDTPTFRGMFDVCALIAGGSALAAREVWANPGMHAVNIAGGLHHAMAEEASGFCVVNDAVIAIHELLAAGAQRVGYVDLDVHHGDGVEAAFYDDPRVLTISIHQDPRTLFPGTGRSSDIGRGSGEGAAINVPLPPRTDDLGWTRAFRAIVPGALRAFAPEVLVTQCGCDTHRADPLADLALSIDGQRTAIEAMHTLSHELTGGRWVALGGGGYNVAGCVPLTWTHLIAEMSGHPIDPWQELPTRWREATVRRSSMGGVPTRMGELPEGVLIAPAPWTPGGDDPLDLAIGATRSAAFPLLGLDPFDPRD